MKIYTFLLYFLLFFSSSMFGTDIKSMIEGMGESFGAPPKGFVYSYEVWNDAHVPMYVEQEGIASFMGAFFQSGKGYFQKKKLPSIYQADGAISRGQFHNQDYYFKFYISDNKNPHEDPIYTQFLTQLPLEKNDPNVYYFHAFTQRGFSKGNFIYKPQVEMVGVENPKKVNKGDNDNPPIMSSQLSALNFFNSSGFNVQVSLTYGNDPYKFTVEKYSHCALTLPTPEEKKSVSSTDSAGTMKSIAAAPNKEVQIHESQQKSNQFAMKDDVAIQAVATDAVAISTSVDTAALPADTTTKKEEDVTPPPFSLRPNTITFSVYKAETKQYETFQTLKLPVTGFDGKVYTIEIFEQSDKKLNVGIQGLMPGNYDLASGPRSRDITPCPCTFWYKSLEQTDVKAEDGYLDLPGQVWVVYAGGDNPIFAKVLPGQAVSWNLTRPFVGYGDRFVYFVYVATTDDAKALNFVQKIAGNQLGKEVMQPYKKSVKDPFIMKENDKAGLDVQKSDQKTSDTMNLSADEQVAALMGDLSVNFGAIEDKDQQIIGYILGTDIFMPKGLGFGRFYYSLNPSLMSSSNIVYLLNSFLDEGKAAGLGGDVSAALKRKIDGWLAGYLKDPLEIAKQVEQFLVQYGNAKIVAGGQLTKYGKGRLETILSGPISLQYPSLKLSTVTNQYVYDFGKSGFDTMPKARKLGDLKMVSSQPKMMTVEQEKDRARKQIINNKLSPIVYGPGFVATDAAVDAATKDKNTKSSQTAQKKA